MFAKRVHPNIISKLGISHRNVTGLAFCEPFPGEVSEYRRGVDENMFSMFLMSRKFWDACTREFHKYLLPQIENTTFQGVFLL
jgi:hypothetical protein